MDSTILDRATKLIFTSYEASSEGEEANNLIQDVSHDLFEILLAYESKQIGRAPTTTAKTAIITMIELFVASIQNDYIVWIFTFISLIACYWQYISLYAIILFFFVSWRVWEMAKKVLISSLEDSIVWIGRESRLLLAIVKDARRITALSYQVQEKAQEVWRFDSKLSSTMPIAGLTESQLDWVNRAEGLVNKAEALLNKPKVLVQEVRRFDSKLSSTTPIAGLTESQLEWVNRGEGLVNKAEALPNKLKVLVQYAKGFVLAGSWRVLRLIVMDGLFAQLEETKQLKAEINKIIVENSSRVHICRSLETSWSMIRKLVSRPIEQHESEYVKHRILLGIEESICRSRELVKSLTSGIQFVEANIPSFDVQFIKLQVGLLSHFLRQVEGLKLESDIGDAWVLEIEEIVNSAWVAIQDFTKRLEHSLKLGFVLFFTVRILNSRKLKKKMDGIYVQFYDLLESKERHGFKLIRRDLSNTNQNSLDETNNNAYSLRLDNIRQSLYQESVNLGDALIKLIMLCYQLDKLWDTAKEYEIRNVPTSTSLREEILVIAILVDQSIDTYRNDSLEGGINKARERLYWEVDYMENRLHLLKMTIDAYNVESRVESSSAIGLEEDIHQVVSRLTTNGDDSCSVVSVVGMDGVGKTTLGKKIFSHRAIEDCFDVRVWVTLPCQHPNDESVLEIVAQQIIDGQGGAEHLEEFWFRKVSGKKYLIVLDNVSTKEAWKILSEKFLPTRPNGGKVLLTTSSEEVASIASQNRGVAHKLRLRTKEESLRLFKQIVHICPKEEATAKKIVDRCLGLPQAILHVGYLTLWRDVSASKMLEHLIEKNLREPQAEIVKMANKELDSDLRECLKYVLLFPQDFELPARRVVALWVAEGLVHNNRDRIPEDIAYEYLSELIDHNIIQVVKREPSGKVKTCCLPVVMRETWLSKLSPQQLGDVSRLADYFDRSTLGFDFIHGNNLDTPQDLRSFLSFDPREGDEPGKDIGKFLNRGIKNGCFLHLQVLDFERVFRPELPDAVGKLSKLRYLGLRWTYLENIPSTVGQLTRLETLDVKHTDLRTLPVSVWKLPGLRHLYLNKSNRSKFIRHPSGTFLKNLETLWNVSVDKSNPLKNRLDELTSLRKLGLSMQLESYEERVALSKRIAKMKHLRCLRLRSADEMGIPCILSVSLSGFNNLSLLNLFGILEDPSMIAEFPKNLIELTLSASLLSEDPMPVLEKLSSLKLLCLYSNSYTGKRMVCSKGGFPQLLVLRMWKLQQLEEWDVDESSMLNLRELEIRSCDKLKKLPDGLKNLKTLLEVKSQLKFHTTSF